MNTYEVTLYKAIKGNEKRDVIIKTHNAKDLFPLKFLSETVEGRMLIGRFAELCTDAKIYKNSYLVAKKVGVLGKFTSKLLKEELKNRGNIPEFKRLLSKGELYISHDNQLELFKGDDAHPKLRQAFTERYFATFDICLHQAPWGAKRNYFIIISKE